MPQSLRPLKLTPSSWILGGLLVLYVIVGLFGHDPWKSDDVFHLAIAKNLLDPGQGFGLSLAGKPFLAAPLYYWSAALSGQLLGSLIPLHDAMRLINALWVALALAGLYYASRELYKQDSAAATPLLLAGTLGLIVRAHEAQPVLVLMAALSILLLACSLLPRKPWASAALLAPALIMAVLGQGLPGLLLFITPLILALVLYRPPHKTLIAVGAGLLGGSLIVLLVGWGLYQAEPVWFQAWMTQELGLFTRPNHYFTELYTLITLLPWFSWPLIPLACWTLWSRRRHWRETETLLPLGAFLLGFILLPFVLGTRETTAILLLPSLALLATPGTLNLRRGAANAFDWFSGMVFTLFAGFLWVGWAALVFGWPEKLARRANVLWPGVQKLVDFNPVLFALALIVSLAWFWLMFSLPRSPYRCLTRWTAGLLTIWLLTMILWLPGIEYVKTYRPLTAAVVAQLPKNPGCVAETGLGDAQEASFAYFQKLYFRPLKQNKINNCRWLLVQGMPKTSFTPPEKAWQKVWEGSRPGDRRERFRLYKKRDNPDS